MVRIQLHGFCDASEVACASVVYLRAIYFKDCVHISLVMAKRKVVPINWLLIPHLGLCSGVFSQAT